MDEDVFHTCLIEAETLAESRGGSRSDKHILGMYRNYSFEKNIEQNMLNIALKTQIAGVVITCTVMGLLLSYFN